MTTEVVKFDVGGQVYKVSRSLLQMHPNSMLAKSASDQWQEDPEAEIFIEGNSFRFQYILDCLRHGSVTLPITESKEAVLRDLEYYGIEVTEEAIDHDSTSKKARARAAKLSIAELKENTNKILLDYRCAQLATDCIRSYLDLADSSGNLGPKLNKDKDAIENILALRTLVNGDDQKARKGANVHLNAVGLNLAAYQTAYGKYYDSSGKYVNGWHCSTATLEEIDVVQTEE